jgi:hypothetical protein
VAQCGHSGLAARDPLVSAQRAEGPSTYGLLPYELRAEARRLRRGGWSPDEIRQRLAVRLVSA